LLGNPGYRCGLKGFSVVVWLLVTEEYEACLAKTSIKKCQPTQDHNGLHLLVSEGDGNDGNLRFNDISYLKFDRLDGNISVCVK
jgi:hypothetical protein